MRQTIHHMRVLRDFGLIEATSVVDDGPPRYVSRLDRHPAWVAEAVKSQAES